MNTPITDALADKWAGDPDARGYREELEEVAPRLELDRAALIKALETSAQFIAPVNSRVAEGIRNIISAARANFLEQ